MIMFQSGSRSSWAHQSGGGQGDCSSAQVESYDGMKRHVLEKEEITILPGFKNEQNWSHTRSRQCVKHESNILPIMHSGGGGDGTHQQRPPSQSYTSRMLKARKAAQLEYKAQLDLQIAQQKQLKQSQSQKETFMGTGSIRGPIVGQAPAEKKSVPYLPSWFTPPPAAHVHPSEINPLAPAIASVDHPHSSTSELDLNLQESEHISQHTSHAQPDSITFSSFPLVGSNALEESRTTSIHKPSSQHQTSHKGSDHEESIVSTANTTPSTSSTNLTSAQSRSQKLQQPSYRSFIFPPLPQTATETAPAAASVSGLQQQENIIPPPENFSSSNGSFDVQNSKKAGHEGHEMILPFCSPSQTPPTGLSPTPYAQQQQTFGSAVLVPSLYCTQSPLGSPCGSVGDQSGGPSIFGSPSRYKAHVSQTADQRPEESVLRTLYKNELEQQIQERKRQEDERLRQERLEEERLQQKIQQDQERMLKEYKEEQLRLKQKEEEKRQRQEEILKREEEIRKAAEEERKRKQEERRQQRLSFEAANEKPIQEQARHIPPPHSPPIATLLKPEVGAISTNHSPHENAEEMEDSMSVISNTSVSGSWPRRRRNSGITETLAVLAQVREILEREKDIALMILEQHEEEFMFEELINQS